MHLQLRGENFLSARQDLPGRDPYRPAQVLASFDYMGIIGGISYRKIAELGKSIPKKLLVVQNINSANDKIKHSDFSVQFLKIFRILLVES